MISSAATFLTIFLFFQVVFCSKDNDKAILSQMQDWGKNIFDIIGSKIKDTEPTQQYLVAALLPDAALDKPNEFSKILFKGCPKEPNIGERLIECSTSAVILNKESEELWKKSNWNSEEKYKDHLWHGEYRLLHDGIIDRLVHNFYEVNGRNAQCRVFLYSYFIPCAIIKCCPYQCSEEIANYNNRGGKTCRITAIGYTRVFGHLPEIRERREEAAREYLKAVENLYHTVEEVKTYAIGKVKENNQPVSFQELMYDCLLNSPLSGCCVDYSDSRENSELVIAYFVNEMVYSASQSPKFKHRFTSISNTAIYDLNRYFREWIKDRVKTDCTTCGVKHYNVFVVQFCSKTALDLASGFGSPASLDLSSPHWGVTPGETFKNLYRTSPIQFQKTKMVKCNVGLLSSESLCTSRTKASKKSHSSAIQGQSSKRSKLDSNRGL